MKIGFEKYQGAGNDFVLIDNREKNFPETDREKYISAICNRHFGVGADGLILLENHSDTDFSMRYFNSDGHPSSMCGNGGRCVVAFASRLGMVDEQTQFVVNDAVYYATLMADDKVALQMQDVDQVAQFESHYFTDTGSPHHVVFVSDVQSIAVTKKGREIRYGSPYGRVGTNVNFVAIQGANRLAIRTYERGVEAETMACGTGAVAAAISAYAARKIDQTTIDVLAIGGVLEVSFLPKEKGFSNIILRGPAHFVFKGQWFYE